MARLGDGCLALVGPGWCLSGSSTANPHLCSDGGPLLLGAPETDWTRSVLQHSQARVLISQNSLTWTPLDSRCCLLYTLYACQQWHHMPAARTTLRTGDLVSDTTGSSGSSVLALLCPNKCHSVTSSRMSFWALAVPSAAVAVPGGVCLGACLLRVGVCPGGVCLGGVCLGGVTTSLINRIFDTCLWKHYLSETTVTDCSKRKIIKCYGSVMLLLVLQNKTINKLNSRVERLEKEKWNPYRQIWDLRMQLYHMEQSIESNFTERLGFLENSTTGIFN